MNPRTLLTPLVFKTSTISHSVNPPSLNPFYYIYGDFIPIEANILYSQRKNIVIKYIITFPYFIIDISSKGEILLAFLIISNASNINLAGKTANFNKISKSYCISPLDYYLSPIIFYQLWSNVNSKSKFLYHFYFIVTQSMVPTLLPCFREL